MKFLRLLTLGLLASWLSGCATGAPQPPPPPPPVLLLGEVHDNAVQHAQRLDFFKQLLASGARPALAMEQIDRERQGAIDALRSSGAVPTVDALVSAATTDAARSGWNWDFYRPFIAAALDAGVPIVAANVSRDDARRVMREGLAPLGFDATVPADVLKQHVQEIEASHCGLIDTATAGRMALAQAARDQFMAQVLATHAARGVVLLAGNGHVRNDVGAPRWLPPAVRARSQAIGWLEAGNEADRAAYDQVRVTPAQARPDPCEGMRKSIPARPAPAATR